MRNLWKLLIASSLLAVPAAAQAQESYASVRVEPGVAAAVGNPQDDRFDVGGGVALKAGINITDILGIGPMFQVLAFHSKLEDVDTPTIVSVGGFLQVHRPHGYQWNDSEGAAAVSPWIDLDAQFVRTGPLNRFGTAVGVGAAFPLEPKRIVWLGPFLRYQLVTQNDDVIGMNTNDSHTLILGASLEFDEAHAKPLAPKPADPVKPEQPAPQPSPQPEKPQFQDVDMQLKQVVPVSLGFR
jgi:hypothetical protein